MGWPARTWVTDELVTAAIMNADHRDNLNTLTHLIARKTSDQTVTSSTVLVNDTALVMPVAANEVWQFRLGILYRAGTVGDFKAAFTFPGGEIGASANVLLSGGSLGWIRFEGTSSPAAGSAFIDGISSTTSSYFDIDGVYINGGAAGNLQFQWAQNTSDATATTVKANSTIWGMKLA